MSPVGNFLSKAKDKLGNSKKVSPADEVQEMDPEVGVEEEFEENYSDDDDDEEEPEEEVEEPDSPKSLREKKATVDAAINDELRKYAAGYQAQDDGKFVDSTKFNSVVGFFIMLNALCIGMETDFRCKATERITCAPEDDQIWLIFNYIFCFFYIIEMLARMYEYGWADFYGVTIPAYFKDNWCNFDFALVTLNVLDLFILPGNLGPISVLRIIRMARLVRLVRLLRAFRELWLIVSGMAEAAKALFWVMLLLIIIMYVWAIILTITVGQNEESKYFDYSYSYWKKDDYWGSVPASMYSLFQLMTRDSWSMAMIRPVVTRTPGLVILYLTFICLVGFGLMNIIVGVVVENTMACAKENEEKIQQMQDSEQHRVLDSLKAIFEASDTNGDGTLDREEFIAGMKKKEVKERLATIDIPVQDLNELYDLLDENQDKSITITEFFKGCEKLKGVAKSRDIIDLSVKVSMYLQMSTELLHGKRCQYKDRSGNPCQNRAKGRWVPEGDMSPLSPGSRRQTRTGINTGGAWVFEFCEEHSPEHGGYHRSQPEGPPRGMKQQGEVLERVMERLEIMDKEFLRADDAHRRRRKRTKPGSGMVQ